MPNIFDARRTYASTLAFIPGREELPFLLNERRLFGCGVKVGVKEGEFSEHILREWWGAHLISVDPRSADAPENYVDIANVPQEPHEAFYRKTVQRLAQFGTRSSIWRTTSAEAAARIPHHSLDFVYLDARHDFASVMEDLHAWFDKVRPRGIIAGHGYLDGHFAAGVFGVKSAVDKFFGERDIPVYCTLLDEPWVSWMVQVPLPEHAEGARVPTAPALDALRPGVALVAPPAEQTPALDRQLVSLRLDSDTGTRRFQMSLDPSQMSQQMMLQCLSRNELYESGTSRFLGTVLREGDTFVDVGAHVGFFSLLGAVFTGPSGQVISFEPEEENYRHLVENIRLNGFTHVVPVNSAVGDAAGIAQLYVNADNDGGHALWDVGLHAFNARSRATPRPRRVRVTTLDGFFAGRAITSLKAIKIDAEGGELRILQGAKGTLERHRVPFVICEVNRFALERMGTSETQLRAFMAGLGYEAYLFAPDGGSLVRLVEDQTVVGDEFVFNLMFRHPSAPAVGATA
jgi:FkbM family methyltransferase